MTSKTKLILGISLTAFVLGSTGVLWGIFMPVGAIFLGLFMSFYMLGKESALFDEEQRLRTALAEKNTAAARSNPQQAATEMPLSTASAR